MNATPPVVPLWAEAYIPDFRALQQILERAQNFFLQPVETPSPDLSRIFADWLRAAGWDVRLIELREPESWTTLAETLQEEPPRGLQEANRAVVVSAPHDLDVDVMCLAMARINMQRDMIARTMNCPLLWFGTRSFQQSTWEHAPDFWSIASVPYRIPLRDLADAQRHTPTSMAWWTGAANDDVTSLETAFATRITAGSNSAETVRAGLRLAECQLTRGDLGAATQILERIRPWLHADLEPRWQMLHHALQTAEKAGSTGIIDQIHGRIAEAKARGAKRMEAVLRFQLADHLRAVQDADCQREGLAELIQARSIFAELGDALEVLHLDSTLSKFDNPPDPTLLLSMVENAEAVLGASEDPEIGQDAALVLARLYRWQDRRHDAERMLARVLQEDSGSHTDSPSYFNALQTGATLAYERGDWPLVYELTTKLINNAQRRELHAMEGVARIRRAGASLAMLKPLHACIDLLAVEKIAWSGSIYGTAFVSLRDASSLASSLGITQIAAALLLRAVSALLHELSTGTRDRPLLDTSALRTAGETELAERLDELGRWIADIRPTLPESEVQQRLVELRQEFQQILDLRETELRSQGIDMMDPLTWGISEEPPPAP